MHSIAPQESLGSNIAKAIVKAVEEGDMDRPPIIDSPLYLTFRVGSTPPRIRPPRFDSLGWVLLPYIPSPPHLFGQSSLDNEYSKSRQ